MVDDDVENLEKETKTQIKVFASALMSDSHCEMNKYLFMISSQHLSLSINTTFQVPRTDCSGERYECQVVISPLLFTWPRTTLIRPFRPEVVKHECVSK
jgi:hypothetical protein